ncbi:MAG: sigma 54-interacting transcriptional regulator [Succinivibrio sp.]
MDYEDFQKRATNESSTDENNNLVDKAHGEPEKKWNNGPIRTMTDDIQSQKIYLLCSLQYANQKEDIERWVKRGNKSPVHVITTDVVDPTSYDEILNALNKFYDDYFDVKNPSRFIFNITPGTPAMQAMTLFFGGSKFVGAKFYATRDPRYVTETSKYYYEVKLPFTLPSALNVKVPSASTTIGSDIRQDVIRNYAIYPSISILLTGESGVGKTEFAKEIHNSIPGSDPNKFVYVNCAEIATDPTNFSVELFGANKGAYTGLTQNRIGKFELAQGGTLFLDEIGEIPFSMQSILLNAIQNKEIRRFNDNKIIKLKDLRIISATNKDLITAVQEGLFREDLYYRISMCSVPLKTLRDIAATDEHAFNNLLKSTIENINKEVPDFASVSHLDKETYDFIKNQSWPGNLRQLHHVLVLSCANAIQSKHHRITKEIVETHLSRMSIPFTKNEDSTATSEPDFIPNNLEKWLKNKKIEFIKKALVEAKNNVSVASKRLGCNYQNLNNFVKKNGIKC